MKDIDDEFPPNSRPYNDEYDYLSDSDLEDEYSSSGEDEAPREGGGGPNSQRVKNAEDKQKLRSKPSNLPPPRPKSTAKNGPPRMGKVAVIRDMAAVTYV